MEPAADEITMVAVPGLRPDCQRGAINDEAVRAAQPGLVARRSPGSPGGPRGAARADRALRAVGRRGWTTCWLVRAGSTASPAGQPTGTDRRPFGQGALPPACHCRAVPGRRAAVSVVRVSDRIALEPLPTAAEAGRVPPPPRPVAFASSRALAVLHDRGNRSSEAARDT
jgi:hypothetical protein